GTGDHELHRENIRGETAAIPHGRSPRTTHDPLGGTGRPKRAATCALTRTTSSESGVSGGKAVVRSATISSRTRRTVRAMSSGVGLTLIKAPHSKSESLNTQTRTPCDEA